MRVVRHLLVSVSLAMMAVVACAPKTAPPAAPASAPAPAARRRRLHRQPHRALRPRRRALAAAAPATPAATAAAGEPAAASRRSWWRPWRSAASAASSGAGHDADPVKPIVSATAPSPDPRVGLKPGRWDAAQAAWNLKLVSTTPPRREVPRRHELGPRVHRQLRRSRATTTASRCSDISNPPKPEPVTTYRLPGVAERRLRLQEPALRVGRGPDGPRRLRHPGRARTGEQGSPARHPHLRHHRHREPEVRRRTCRRAAARTRTRSSPIRRTRRTSTSTSPARRRASRRASCRAARTGPIDDPNTALFRIEVIQVPLAAPEKAAIVSSPRIFNDLAPPPRRVEPGRGGAPAAGTWSLQRRAAAAAPSGRSPQQARRRLAAPAAAGGRGGGRGNTGPNQCHDITVYPAIGLAGGACGGYGLLLDIRDVAQPEAHRRRRPTQLLLLALGDVQQRRHQDPVHRRVGRRLAAALPRDRQDGVGRQRDLHDREQAR